MSVLNLITFFKVSKRRPQYLIPYNISSFYPYLSNLYPFAEDFCPVWGGEGRTDASTEHGVDDPVKLINRITETFRFRFRHPYSLQAFMRNQLQKKLLMKNKKSCFRLFFFLFIKWVSSILCCGCVLDKWISTIPIQRIRQLFSFLIELENFSFPFWIIEADLSVSYLQCQDAPNWREKKTLQLITASFFDNCSAIIDGDKTGLRNISFECGLIPFFFVKSVSTSYCSAWRNSKESSLRISAEEMKRKEWDLQNNLLNLLILIECKYFG